jgi:hypothetical protein
VTFVLDLDFLLHSRNCSIFPLYCANDTACSHILDEIIYLFQTKAVSCYGCGLKYKRDEENNTLVVRKFCEREFTTMIKLLTMT